MSMRMFFARAASLALAAVVSAGAQWQQDAEVDAPYVEALFVYEDKLYAGADSLVYVKTRVNGDWTVSSPLPVEPGAGVSCLLKSGARLFAGTFGHGIFESTDDGATWVSRSTGLNNAYQVTSFVQRDDKLYAGTAGNGVFVLDLTSGTSWTAYRNGLPFNTGAWDVSSIYNHSGTLILSAGASGYVYFNEPGSDLWVDRQFGIAGGAGLNMHSVAGIGDTIIGAANTGFFRSADGGVNWDYYYPGTGLTETGSFASYGGRFYCTTAKSTFGTFLFFTDDNGLSWTAGEHLPGILSVDMTVFGSRLYAGTFSGLWYKELGPSGIDDDLSPSSFELYQNYPNPFNPSTTISYKLLTRSFVSLKVYDVLGNEIAEPVNEEKPAGSYTVSFDGSDLSSGVYFYELRAGSFVQVRKMVLMR